MHTNAYAGMAEAHEEIREIALSHDLISAARVLDMENGLASLLSDQPTGVFDQMRWSHLVSGIFTLFHGWDQPDEGGADSLITDLASVGQYLAEHPVPWTTRPGDAWDDYPWNNEVTVTTVPSLSSIEYLGAAAVLLMSEEFITQPAIWALEKDLTPHFGALNPLYDYIKLRRNPESTTPLPELPVPDDFKQLFRDWAHGNVNFTAPGPSGPSAPAGSQASGSHATA